jgi:hypothetical protein
MSIYNDTRQAETGREYEIGGLSADAGQFEKLRHGFGNAAVESLRNDPRSLDQMPRFCTEKPETPDYPLDIMYIGLGHRCRIGPAGEKAGRRPINLLIRTLGGKGDRAAQLEAAVVPEKRLGLGP